MMLLWWHSHQVGATWPDHGRGRWAVLSYDGELTTRFFNGPIEGDVWAIDGAGYFGFGFCRMRHVRGESLSMALPHWFPVLLLTAAIMFLAWTGRNSAARERA